MVVGLPSFLDVSVHRVSGFCLRKLCLNVFLPFALLTVAGYIIEWGRGSVLLQAANNVSIFSTATDRWLCVASLFG